VGSPLVLFKLGQLFLGGLAVEAEEAGDEHQHSLAQAFGPSLDEERVAQG
jgi:hypothetical protein